MVCYDDDNMTSLAELFTARYTDYILCRKKTRQIWQVVVSTSMHGLILIIFGKAASSHFQKRYAYSTFLVHSVLLTLFAFR